MLARTRLLPVVLVAAATLGTALSNTPPAIASPSNGMSQEAAKPVAALQCTPGLLSTLTLDGTGESVTPLPAEYTYSANSRSSPAGQGNNPSSVGYRVDVTSPSGVTSTKFGTSATDSGEGVPWANDSGVVGEGGLPAWALDTTQTGAHKVTVTYDRPVYGMRTAVTDLDTRTESITMDAFAEEVGGSAIPLNVEKLDNPSSIPILAPTKTHTGSTAYIQDQTAVGQRGANGFESIRDRNVSDASASVYFAYDSEAPVQRLEMTYTVDAGRGFWFVPPSVPQACVQPSFEVSDVYEGGVATLHSQFANHVGNGRVEDIGFTYNLPEGVVVADDPAIVAGDCAGKVTAVPGASTITVSGASVGSGDAECDFAVDLKFTKPGSVTLDASVLGGASNIVVGGTVPTSITVAPDSPALTADLAVEFDGDAAAPKAGDQVVYTSTVSNTGNTALSGIVLTDSLGTSLVCDDDDIAIGDATVCESSRPYTLTQTDVDGGTLHNALAGEAAAPSGKTAHSSAARATLTLPASASIAAAVQAVVTHNGSPVAVSVFGESIVVPGDEIAFTTTVTNGGNTTVGALSVIESPHTRPLCSVESLAPGESTTCVSTTPHVISPADITTGEFVHTAVVEGVAPRNPDDVSSLSGHVIRSKELRTAVFLNTAIDVPILAHTGVTVESAALIGALALVIGVGGIVLAKRRRPRAPRASSAMR